MGDRLLDSLRDSYALRVQVADELMPVDRFANALQVSDDRVRPSFSHDRPLC
jgi:hypothetical protein